MDGTKCAVTLSCKIALAQNSPELSLLTFLPLIYQHSDFLATTLDFTSFFTIAFLRAAFFFYSLAVLFFHFFYTPKGLLDYHFFFTTGRRKDEAV